MLHCMVRYCQVYIYSVLHVYVRFIMRIFILFFSHPELVHVEASRLPMSHAINGSMCIHACVSGSFIYMFRTGPWRQVGYVHAQQSMRKRVWLVQTIDARAVQPTIETIETIVRGPVYDVLHSMYAAMRSSVALGNKVSSPFDQLIGCARAVYYPHASSPSSSLTFLTT